RELVSTARARSPIRRSGAGPQRGTPLSLVIDSSFPLSLLANAMLSDLSPIPGPRRRELTADAYYAGVRARDVAVLARALTLIESSNSHHQPAAEGLLTRLLPHTGHSVRVGVTGVPGVGKSTFIDTLGLRLVRRGLRVAVLAVDPSSGLSGGSI